MGGNQWYKNREGVIRILARLLASRPDLTGALKLVMAGKPPTEAMLHLVSKENLNGMVFFLGKVSNEQLCALYSSAEALVFPSLREGFGWPILEAQACGCPVVTSDRPPMNHLGGTAALLANPEDPDDFAGRLRELLAEDDGARLRRKNEALRHAARYDPQSFIEAVLRAYGTTLQV